MRARTRHDLPETSRQGNPAAPGRRRFLIGAAAGCAAPLAAQPGPGRAGGTSTAVRIAQMLDMSPAQQELSRDYSTGVRLAWSERTPALRADVQLTTFDTDGSADSVRRALTAIRDDVTTCALLGAAGEQLAGLCLDAAQRAGLEVAHVGPWMADSRHDRNPDAVCLFASREMQMRHALRSLEGMGITDIGIVYADARLHSAHDEELTALAQGLTLRTHHYRPQAGEDVGGLARRLPATLPVVVLFVGGTVELARLSQGLSERRMQRYLVSLSDVDATTLAQIGTGATTSLILTQVVPNPQTSALPVVRSYRQRLKELFDESPTPVSLAGYLAGRYARQVLARIEGPLNRASVQAAFRRRPTVDLGGFVIDFSGQSRGSSFVTQTMLTGQGRLIG